jgi:hypothetical protein
VGQISDAMIVANYSYFSQLVLQGAEQSSWRMNNCDAGN